MSLNAVTSQKNQAHSLDWTIWLRSQRRRVVDFLLAIIVVLGGIGLAYLIGSRLLDGQDIGMPNLYYLAMYAMIVVVFLAKGMRAEWRAGILLLLIYTFGVLSYWLGWHQSGGRVFMMALVVVGGVLVHPRAGAYLAVLVMLTYIAAGLAFSHGWWGVSWGDDALTTRSIIREGLGLLINVGLVVASLWFMGQALVAATEANRQAQEARALAAQHADELEIAIRDLQIAKEQAEAARLGAEAARKHAEEADRVKSQFLASMSHELRTPMNAILNFSQVIGMGIAGPVTDKQKEMLDEVVGSGKHLLALINDVLDMSKIQSGMISLFAEEDIDLHEVIRAAAATVGTLIKDKPVELVMEIDADLPRVLCDKRRVQQVLLNLLANATKFTEKGRITLRANAQGEAVAFAVIDTGIGVAAEDVDLIFEPFAQTEAGIRHAGGSGLGLPISKSLVEAHGGRLWVESKVGEGAAFHFTLPVDPPILRQQIAASDASGRAAKEAGHD